MAGTEEAHSRVLEIHRATWEHQGGLKGNTCKILEVERSKIWTGR